MNIVPAFIRQRILNRPYLLKIFNNIGWLFFDKVIRLGVGLFIVAWVARYLGPERFGLLSFATAYISVFVAVAGLGLQSIVVRDIVRDPACKYETLGTAAVLLMASGLIAYSFIISFIILVRPHDDIAKVLVAILGTTMLFKFSEVAAYWFESQILSKYTVWVQNGSFLIFAVVKVTLILSEASLMAFAWAITAEALTVALMMLIMLCLHGPRLPQLYCTMTRAKSLLKHCWPLLLSGVAIGLAMRADQIMIGQLLNDTAVGIYSIGVKLAEVFVFGGIMVATTVFPRLIELKDDIFELEFVKIIRFPFYALLILVSAVSVTSGLSIPFIFGQEYVESIPVLSIIIFSIPLTYLSIMSTYYLLRKDLHGEILSRQLIGLIINIILNLQLIPMYGIIGAAIVTVVTDLIISLGMDWRRKKYESLLKMKLSALFFIDKSKL